MISNATVPSLRLWVSASNPELDFFRLWYSFHSPHESGNFFLRLGLMRGVDLFQNESSRARTRAFGQEFYVFCCHICHTVILKSLWYKWLSLFLTFVWINALGRSCFSTKSLSFFLRNIGLFGRNVGLFWKNMGHFCWNKACFFNHEQWCDRCDSKKCEFVVVKRAYACACAQG